MTAMSYPDPAPFTVNVAGVPMSGLVSAVEHPRAVIVALHGGATTPEYFDAPGFPRQSLLRVGAHLGFTVLAPDRPGYGASRAALGDDLSATKQVDFAFGVIEHALAQRNRGAGVFLLGHSQGSVLTAKMAVDDRAADIVGLEIAGTGVEHSASARARLATPPTTKAARSTVRNLLWEPAHLYPSRRHVVSSAPRFEGSDAVDWPDDLTALAPQVTVPVRISLGDHELWWKSGTAGLNSVAALFTASSRVVVDEQYQSGHNLSLGISALAYHLKVLAFVEECVLAQERAAPTPPNIDITKNRHHEMETEHA